jgi:parvulin-like peptidyl-prolyl isomerase
MLHKFVAALLCAMIPVLTVLADSAMPPEESLFIRNTLIQQGIAKGLDKNPELLKRVEEFRQTQIAHLALDAALEAGMPDFSARAAELYEVRKDKQYQLPLRLRVRVLVMDIAPGQEAAIRTQLEDIRTQVAAGKLDFKAAVLAHSSDAERKLTEGDSQWFSRGEKPDAIYTNAEKLSADKPLSDVIVAQNVAYLLYFIDRKAPETRTFEAVKPEIMTELQTEYRETQRKVVLEGFREQFKQKPAM